jgi:hypothetical protein
VTTTELRAFGLVVAGLALLFNYIKISDFGRVIEIASMPVQKTFDFLGLRQNMAAKRRHVYRQSHIDALQGQGQSTGRDHDKALDENRH